MSYHRQHYPHLQETIGEWIYLRTQVELEIQSPVQTSSSIVEMIVKINKDVEEGNKYSGMFHIQFIRRAYIDTYISSTYIFKILQWIGNQMHWIGPEPKATPQKPRRDSFWGVALRYRYKRDLHQQPRVTRALLWIRRPYGELVRVAVMGQ